MVPQYQMIGLIWQQEVQASPSNNKSISNNYYCTFGLFKPVGESNVQQYNFKILVLLLEYFHFAFHPTTWI